MATRFETQDGQNLGMKFAGRRKGKPTLHLTTKELTLLFSLDEDTELDGDSWGWTAGQLLDLWKSGDCHKADQEDMKNWGRESLDDTLGFQKETKLFLGKDGPEEKTAFKR